jgi:L-ascorbate metabolism protein UlaG (beta-lactamase superfamily)
MATFSTPSYTGPLSDHFNGKTFFNPGPAPNYGPLAVFRWMLNRKPGPWRKFTPAEPAPPPPQRVDDLRVTFVNHATVLIQMNGVNLLTDPVWSERVSPVGFAGPKRRKPPGIRFEDLPPIDIVLLSHNHYDHLDEAYVRRLAREHQPRFIVPLGVDLFLKQLGITDVTTLDWWDSFDMGNGIHLTCVQAKHFSGRGLSDRNTTLWCGYMLEGGAGQVYFAGDTGMGDFFEEVARRFSAIRLSILPIGAYKPRWFMEPVHMAPDDAVAAYKTLGAAWSMGIHFGTFMMADDGEDEPVELLHKTLDTEGILRERFIAPGNGEAWDVPPR